MTDIVTFGEAMGLLLATGTYPLDQARQFDRSVAGSEANVAVGLRRLGHDVTFVTRLGNDSVGSWVETTLRAEGMHLAIARIESAPTGLLLRDAPSGRPVQVSYHRAGSAASTLEWTDIGEQRVRAARVLFVTALTSVLSSTAEKAVATAVDVAWASGVAVVFDPNVRLRLAEASRWRQVVATLAPRTDAILVGDDELRILDMDAATLLALGCGAVVVKRGAHGARHIDAHGVIDVPARRVAVVDVVGAGDAFAAGWISGLLNESTAVERLRRGCAVASMAVTCRGDIEGLPGISLLGRLAEDLPTDVLR